VCVYASDSRLEKCKLEGHILDITQAHQALVPWNRQSNQIGPVEYVVARSSLPLEQRVLHDRSPPDEAGISRFTAFSRSVKARLLQDLKLLPLRNPETDTLDRQNITVYLDEPGNQILLVYAPTTTCTTPASEQRLEFISFNLSC